MRTVANIALASGGATVHYWSVCLFIYIYHVGEGEGSNAPARPQALAVAGNFRDDQDDKE
jgi:hypothetical protein